MKKIIGYHKYEGGVWIRLLGWWYGISIESIRVCGYSFSERNGYSRYLRVGDWKIKVLSPSAYQHVKTQLG